MRGNKNLIPISALVTFGAITFASLEEKGSLPSTNQWLGFVVAFTVVAALADLGLPLAGGLAVLTMIAILLERGGAALTYITKQEDRGSKAEAAAARRKHRQGVLSPLEGGSGTMPGEVTEPLQPVSATLTRPGGLIA